MELDLKGKTVIVTGGGWNIGRGITLAFAKEGSNVVIAEMDQPRGEKVVEDAQRLGAKNVILIKTDVTKPDQVERLVTETLGNFKTIDVLVNNAGAGSWGSFVEKPREATAQELDLNLWSFIHCIRTVLPHMIARKSGSIVNIASGAGRQGVAGLSIYSTAKAGVIGLTQALAREVGSYGIRLNCIAPGRIHGPIPDYRSRGASREEALKDIEQRACIKRLGTPEDIANATVFLASNAASYITGQTLSVCGGVTFH